MTYTALYRKFRPKTFHDVIGQEHIVKTLKNQILSGRVSHAYLFCGTRGTGKTSTAKIFARVINCLEPVEGEPCNICSLCAAANEGNSMNVIEIDAASNNGVDNIREIREEVKYPPTEGRYKVYIIDEVHMLSTGAFNALLKTLEEPPAHVIFILATTDPQKVPATILSRCQRFDFRRISSKEIVLTLKKYLAEEGVEAEEKALYYVAGLADGSMRDCLSIIDQCIAFYYGEEITLDKVLDIVGSVDSSIFFSMTEAILAKDIKGGMDLIEEVIAQGRDIEQFVTELILHFRNLLVVVSMKDSSMVLDLSQEAIQQLKTQSQKCCAEELIYLIRFFSELSSNLKYTQNGRILLEVAYLKLCSPNTEKNADGVAARLRIIEKKLEEGVFTVSIPEKKIQTKEKPKRKPEAVPEDIQKVIENWAEIVGMFNGSVKGIVTAVKPVHLEGEALYFVCDNRAVEELLKRHLEEVQKKLEEKLEKSFQMKTITKQDYDRWYEKEYGTSKKEVLEDKKFINTMQKKLPDAEIVE